MTDTFREYLYRARSLAADIADTEERVLNLWSTCTKQTTSFEQTGGFGGGGGDSKDGPLAALADLTAKVDRYRRELQETEHEMTAFFRQLETGGSAYGKRDAEILILRYVKRLGRKRILEVLIKQGYGPVTTRTLTNWRTGAEWRAEKLWEATYGRTEQGGADCRPLRSGESDVSAAGGMCGTDSGRQ